MDRSSPDGPLDLRPVDALPGEAPPPVDVRLAKRKTRRVSAKERRKALRKLLLTGRGGSQAELCVLLANQGFSTTQSTVSRDLKLLGAERRLDANGDLVYSLEPSGRAAFPAQMVLGVDHNENMVVIKTRIGRAPAVGIEIDNLRDPDVLGTIAGDDTVFIVPTSVTKMRALVSRLRELAELPD